MIKRLSFIAASFVLLASVPASAAITTYSPYYTPFFNDLVATGAIIGSNDLDGIAAGTTGPVVSLGAKTGTFSAGVITAGPAGGDRGPVSGVNFLDVVDEGALTLTFSAPINALGFHLIDAGDAGNTVDMVLSDGTTIAVIPTVGSPSGTVLHYGFIDTINTYTSVTFLNNAGDFYGIDNITIGMLPVSGGVIPEPASASVWGAMLLTGLALVRRKR